MNQVMTLHPLEEPSNISNCDVGKKTMSSNRKTSSSLLVDYSQDKGMTIRSTNHLPVVKARSARGSRLTVAGCKVASLDDSLDLEKEETMPVVFQIRKSSFRRRCHSDDASSNDNRPPQRPSLVASRTGNSCRRFTENKDLVDGKRQGRGNLRRSRSAKQQRQSWSNRRSWSNLSNLNSSSSSEESLNNSCCFTTGSRIRRHNSSPARSTWITPAHTTEG